VQLQCMHFGEVVTMRWVHQTSNASGEAKVVIIVHFHEPDRLKDGDNMRWVRLLDLSIVSRVKRM
jgi:hypothetical protein